MVYWGSDLGLVVYLVTNRGLLVVYWGSILLGFTGGLLGVYTIRVYGWSIGDLYYQGLLVVYWGSILLVFNGWSSSGLLHRCSNDVFKEVYLESLIGLWLVCNIVRDGGLQIGLHVVFQGFVEGLQGSMDEGLSRIWNKHVTQLGLLLFLFILFKSFVK